MTPLSLPREKASLLMEMVHLLQDISEMTAIVVGGSYARGMANDLSDLDLGLYYRPDSPFSISEVRRVAEQFAVTPPVVTDFYGWGPWVNGGAWINTEAGKVDFLYRNLDQVEHVIDDAHRGVTQHDYDQQPPFGFRSVIYLAETKCCVPLYDPHRLIEKLKSRVARYPKALKEAIVQNSLWGAEFSFYFGERFAADADVYAAAGCMTRIAHYLTQALFALNEEYYISDKDAMRQIGQFALRPSEFDIRQAATLAHIGQTSDELRQSLAAIKQLWRETIDLAGDLYKTRYVL